VRWPEGFRCPRRESRDHNIFGHGARRLYQCKSCRHQTSLTAGSVTHSSKLPLRTWFLALDLISQAKTGLSALALIRQLGTSYCTAWLVHHNLMASLAQRDARDPPTGVVQFDSAYLGG
jgi:transposase-like protein